MFFIFPLRISIIKEMSLLNSFLCNLCPFVFFLGSHSINLYSLWLRTLNYSVKLPFAGAWFWQVSLTTISENESDNIEMESDFLISSLGFNDALIMALLALLAFNAWGTETMVIQELECSECSVLNDFVFLTEAFF